MITSVWTHFKISRLKFITQILSNDKNHATDVACSALQPPTLHHLPPPWTDLWQFPFYGESLSLQSSHKPFLRWGGVGSWKQKRPLFSLVSMITDPSGTRLSQFPCGPQHVARPAVRTQQPREISPLYSELQLNKKATLLANPSFPQFLS